MRGKHYGAPLAAKLEHDVTQNIGVYRVKTGERLIKNQQLRFVNDRRDELYLLGHSLGQRFDLLVRPVRKLHPLEPCGDGFFEVGSPLEFEIESKQVADLHLAIQASFLRQITHAVVDRVPLLFSNNADRARTGVGIINTHDHPQCSGLARTVGTYESIHRPFRYGQRKSIHGLMPGKCL